MVQQQFPERDKYENITGFVWMRSEGFEIFCRFVLSSGEAWSFWSNVRF